MTTGIKSITLANGVKLIPIHAAAANECMGCYLHEHTRCAATREQRRHTLSSCDSLRYRIHWLPETPEVIAQRVAQILEGKS